MKNYSMSYHDNYRINKNYSRFYYPYICIDNDDAYKDELLKIESLDKQTNINKLFKITGTITILVFYIFN